MLDGVRSELANSPPRLLLVVDAVHELVSDGARGHHRSRLHAGEVADLRCAPLSERRGAANGTGGSPIRPRSTNCSETSAPSTLSGTAARAASREVRPPAPYTRPARSRYGECRLQRRNGR